GAGHAALAGARGRRHPLAAVRAAAGDAAERLALRFGERPAPVPVVRPVHDAQAGRPGRGARRPRARTARVAVLGARRRGRAARRRSLPPPPVPQRRHAAAHAAALAQEPAMTRFAPRFAAPALAALLALAAPAQAADYVQAPGSTLVFATQYDGETFTGTFPGFSTTFRFDPADLASARLEVTIPLAG